MVAFTLNGKQTTVTAEPDTPLLWVIREDLKHTGTKFGCGAGLCGACTVHINGEAAFSCQTAVSEVAGKQARHRYLDRALALALGVSSLTATELAAAILQRPEGGPL